VLEGLEAKLAQLLAQPGCDQALLAAAKIEAKMLIRKPANILILVGVEDGQGIRGTGRRVSH
jgi:hypothetical protein